MNRELLLGFALKKKKKRQNKAKHIAKETHFEEISFPLFSRNDLF